MPQRGIDDGSWSRAFMVSSGLGVARNEAKNHGSPEWHEARGSNLPRARFIELAHHRETEVREALAGHADCPMGVLASLAHDSRADVRIAVAANPRANQTILEHLAHDKDARVLKAVAHHSTTDVAVLAQLAQHRKEDVRIAAAKALRERSKRASTDNNPNTADARAGLPLELHDSGVKRAEAAPTSVPTRRHAPAVYAPRPRPAR